MNNLNNLPCASAPANTFVSWAYYEKDSDPRRWLDDDSDLRSRLSRELRGEIEAENRARVAALQNKLSQS
jgi:hypothetical protein